MDFKKSQLDAIKTRNKSLIVSAGAGSGKTTVLTHRILDRILDGADISRFLVVTFTKASAADLKNKLYELLSKNLEESPNKRLSDALYKISSASISTVHSFYNDLVNQNFTTLGLGHNYRIGGEIECLLLKKESIEEATDWFLAQNDDNFLEFIDCFAKSKDIDAFLEMMKHIYERITNIPFWHDVSQKIIKKHKEQADIIFVGDFFDSEIGREAKTLVLETLRDALQRMESLKEYAIIHADNDSYAEPLIDAIINLSYTYFKIKEAKSYEECRLSSVVFPSLKRKGCSDIVAKEYIKNEKAAISSRVRATLEALLSHTKSQIVADYFKTIALNQMMTNFILKLNEIFTQKKRDRRILDFTDLELYSLQLLAERTPDGVVRSRLCKDLINTYDEIFIDEYQDINPMQDLIFSLLARHNNRFMVGDSKQSIYRFRNASAEIFNNYINTFAELADDKNNAKIFLQDNFRSAKPIIDFVNKVFESIYTIETAGADYQREKLIYSSNNTCSAPVNVCVSSSEEEEANYVADKIIELINSKRYSYSDITLLFRASNSEAAFMEVFKERNIPYAIEKNENLLEKPEILLAVSMLRVINNTEDEISLAAVLKSPIFRLTADNILQIKSYYGYLNLLDNIKKCAYYYQRHENGKQRYIAEKPLCEVVKKRFRIKKIRQRSIGARPSLDIAQKCNSFVKLTRELYAASLETPCSKLLWSVYRKTDLPAIVSAAKNGAERRNNLYTLYKISLDFEENSFKGVSVFLDYLNQIIERRDNMIDKATKNLNAVKFSTIHNSKGLEFPVCFLCSTDKNFNQRDMTNDFLKYDSTFYAFNITSDSSVTRRKTIIKLVANMLEHKNMIREELRCFYVALTRAKDMLFVTAKTKGTPKEKAFVDCNSYFDWLKYADCGVSYNEPSEDSPTIAEPLPIEDDEVSSIDITSLLNTEYTYTAALELPAKMAISELRVGMLEDDEYTKTIAASDIRKRPAFITEKADAATRGTAMHSFMQFCDFDNIELNGVEHEKQRMVTQRFITPEESDLIVDNRIYAFLASPLYHEMRSSKKVYREKRFNLIENSSFIKKGSDEEILIQGVVDCFFLNSNGNYTVIDYKTDYLPFENAEDILRERHSTQITLYMRAVEQMTGKRVDRGVLYSFWLNKEVEVDVKKETAAISNG